MVSDAFVNESLMGFKGAAAATGFFTAGAAGFLATGAAAFLLAGGAFFGAGSGGRNRLLHRRCGGFLGDWRCSFLAGRCCFLRGGSRSFLGSSGCHKFLA